MDAASAPLLGEEKGYGASGKTEVPSREEEDRRAVEFAMATGPEGLAEAEAAKRLEEFGPNVLEEAKRNELLIFLSFFWGPMPIMIWAATAVVAVEGDWEDFGVLLTLQVVNGTVGFFEEKSAGDAIAALKDSLAPRASVKRSGAFRSVDASTLVPGDLLNVKLGDIVPADCKLLGGKALEVDQAALTGESLPVTRGPGDTVFMGSVIRRGEIEAVVCFTGGRTFFGRAAEMVNRAAGDQQGRFAKVMFQNTIVLFTLSVTLCTVIYFKLMESGLSPIKALGTTVVILIACIPIAMQIVSTTVMAVGGRSLAEKKAILARLSAIEELSGMDILCSDKTGTLTQNKLQLFDPVLIDPAVDKDELVFLGALAAKRMAAGADAIDTVIVASVAERDRPRLDAHEELDFTPFDPVLKRTEATVRDARGAVLRVTKGATKVVLDLCADKAAVEADVLRANQDLADRGFRSIGVAVARGAEGAFKFAGVISLFDPPRVDTKETLERARGMGIAVKMVTGDQTAIAVETSKSIALSARATPVVEDMRAFAAAENSFMSKISGVAFAESEMARDVSTAMAVWSPVTIFTVMPMPRARSSVSFVSTRGGSKRESTPAKRHSAVAPPRATATPRDRKPRLARPSLAFMTASPTACLSEQRSSTTFVAPFVTRISRPSAPATRASVRLSTGSKGVNSSSEYSSRRGRSFSATDATMTVSIASAPDAMRFAASAPRKTSSLASTSGSMSTGSKSWSLFWVSVPVLSLHKMSMPASSSMAESRAKIAFFSARDRPPTAMTVVDTICMAMGMQATKITTTVDSDSRKSRPES